MSSDVVDDIVDVIARGCESGIVAVAAAHY